jgi:putative ABC transport system permease protein
MYAILLYNLGIAWQAIQQNKIRSLLTSLGIVFGVSSVISMLAIGRGAEQEILEQMKLLGTNNIVIQSLVEQDEGTVEASEAKAKQKRPFSPGLSLSDLENIEATIPFVALVSPELQYETVMIRDGKRRSGKLLGVYPSYFDIQKIGLHAGGFFSAEQASMAEQVCVIGYGLASKFFPGEDPIGKQLKCGPLWFTVVGVLENRTQTVKNPEKLGIRDFNMDVFIPAQSILNRYNDRSRITASAIQKSRSGSSTVVFGGGSMIVSQSSSSEEESEEDFNIHQVDKLIVQVAQSQHVQPVADVIYRLLKRRHNEVIDFEIIIPEQLLEQEQRTKTIFNVVLSSIASISLIVGGIGIMNIMLASVLERYREIGVRMAIGARKRDIQLQFLSEALAISLSGGLMGIFLGFVFSYIIEATTGIPTIVSAGSVALAFLVALSVGLVFGIVPARKAADLQPADAVRYE